ncbi:MAG: type I DNA topoisomerase, partial [Chlamydiia bacterium]|nr:type I DNA topoisomerase [Chlamydiia bacterium]
KKVEKEPVEGKEVFLVSNQETAETLAKELERATYQVKSVEKKEKKRNPPPPFITSTLQQEASRHFGFSSSRTMSIAQGLYEGIDLGNDGAEGLITYMRTDSVRLAPEALGEAKRYIAGKYGNEYLPDTPRQYATKKSAQDAHEAIRPTSLKHPPEAVKSFLTREQFMLYQLIWQRFVACQMVPAVYDTVSADISADERFVLRATGSLLKFNGYLAVYQEKEDDHVEDDERLLPPLEENQLLELLDLIKEQSFTRPPPRFTEASLVKELEKSGIGRPSTYAAIMNKIQSRDYTVKESGRLKPTELGRVVVLLLENHFQRIMNIDFTANMEDRLELVAESERDWKELLRSFWEAFEPELKAAEKEAFVPKEETEHKCPDCGANLQKVWYKSKYFLGCTGYPDCNYTAPLEEVTFNKEDYDPNFDWEQKCPQCENDMTLRHGRYGPFLGCSKYPDCKGIVNIPKKGEVATGDTDVACPAIGCEGHLVARRSRFGKIFYSCSTYPDCDVIGNTTDAVKEK